MVSHETLWQSELEDLRAGSGWRTIRTPVERQGKWVDFGQGRLLNLGSNDYLGLADDEVLWEQFWAQAQNTGGPKLGSTGSRLLSGSSPAHAELEQRLEGLYPGRSVLLFNSGYHANTGIVPVLVGPGDAVFADRLCHASLLDGVRLSGARLFRFAHNQPGALEELLAARRGQFRRVLIVTESLFSMDGDVAPLAELVALKLRYESLLLVDEAHAVGVLGPGGRGLAYDTKTAGDIDVLVGTFGKAWAGQGAWCSGSPALVELLRQKARSLLFSTALPPLSVQWQLFLLDQESELDRRRKQLLEICRQFSSPGPIVPVPVGSASAVLAAAEHWAQRGVWAPAIRPPTVPADQCRLRLTLRADLDGDDLALLKNLRDEVTP